jgi:hypothetical protein
MATQVISRVRQAFQVELPMRSLFESDTVADLASEIERRLDAAPGAQLADLLGEVQGLTDEEVERMLAEPGAAPPS